ncbi:hypothetical protein LCGC14_1906280 [marine sediment metagenome]|uniref:Uncharacterized protein n=1 Tax=marine sediment metagenome TaxID=412755 RepID=A0A0F9GIF0_9ZZZZ
MPLNNPPSNRLHVMDARSWSTQMGTDYWAQFGIRSTIAPTGGGILSELGWTTTSLIETAMTGAGDFLSTSDFSVPAHILTDASGDLLESPSVFGDGSQAEAVAQILGHSPTTLSCEWYGSFTVVTGTSNRSGFGLVQDGGAAGTAADQLAWIYTDGTNFTIRSSGDSDAGALDDTDWHTWRIIVSTGSATDAVEWFIDGTSQGTMDRITDQWPVSWGMHALTTNRPAVAWLHIWYE